MSIELCVLASGSMGNCSVLRTPGGVVLIDVGIGPRTTARRMEGTGARVGDVSAVCLTHLDRDHFSPTWAGTLIRHRIRVFCHADRVEDLLRITGQPELEELLEPFDWRAFEPIANLRALPIRLHHDEDGSHGFVFEGFGHRIGYATDLGHVPGHLNDHFEDLDLLALESNYDRDMQVGSSRPWFLKQRIMGGRGHLSNDQAFDAIHRLLNRCEARGGKLPGHIVLLHRSLQCNCPRIVRRVFSRDARIPPRLVLAEQFQRTEWLGPRDVQAAPGEQLVLAWG